MKRINIALTDKQFSAVRRAAKIKELRPGAYVRLAALSAAGYEFIPSDFILPSKIKQTNLFEKEK